MALLPRMGRSFGPVTPPLLALTFVRASFTLVVGLLWNSWPALLGLTAAQLAIAAASLHATWIEPFRVKVTQLELLSPKLQGEAPLRVLQVSDVHFEGWSPRERRLLEAAQDLAPDLILLTGDYLNLSSVCDEASQRGARSLLSSLASLAPTYASPVAPPWTGPKWFQPCSRVCLLPGYWTRLWTCV